MTPTATSVPLPMTPEAGALPSNSQLETPGFESIELSRQIDHADLLHEAELEIVASRRSRSRSRARSVRDLDEGYATDGTPLRLPGGWRSSPTKRKREAPSNPNEHETALQEIRIASSSRMGGDDRPWGVGEWKRLEKVYKSEKIAWTAEREIKALPSSPGWLGWAKTKLTAIAVPKASEWDSDRVLRRFIQDERAEGLGGEWAE